jgi:phospholipid-translocating ATPase
MGGGGKIRKKRNQLSRIHAFSSGKTSFKGEHSLIGGPGFGRIVYCEETESGGGGESSSSTSTVVNYCDNYVRTTKYTMFTFIPKSLFEQFRRVANFYFLVCAILSFFPVSPYSAVSNVVPLVVVVAATIGKEAVEDWRRMKQVIN